MTGLPCGDSADARYCETFWAQHAELEELRTQLAADMDEIERLTAERDYLRERFLWYENDRDKWREAAGSVTADAGRLQGELDGLTRVHATLLEEILRNADEDIKTADEAAEYRAEFYVRFLEQDRDAARSALQAAERVAGSHERALYAAWIDVRHGDPGDADEILAEQLDGYDGPQWNGSETGTEWLERTREAASGTEGATP